MNIKSEEHAVRLEKVKKLREMGIEPWPDWKPVDATCTQVIQEFQEESSKIYAVAGRVINIRVHGKAAFAHIQDSSGKLQVYIKEELVGAPAFQVFEHLIDIGDTVWFSGTAFKTKMGEVTLRVSSYTLLSKSLHPLPEKFHGIADIEVKYRQRYLDLITDQATRERFIKRSHIITAIRSFLDKQGYIEVETPMLHPIVGGAAARPFITHHNALGDDFYLRIAPELYLKRLVIGGFERVYEINRNFRNEGVSTRHNPEFTMLELYTANEDYVYSMNFVEAIIRHAAQTALGTTTVPYGDITLDFSKPFRRISIKDAILEYGQLTEDQISKENIDTVLKNNKLAHMLKALYGEKLLALFELFAEPHFIQPTFAIDYPIETSPLTKRDSKNPEIAPRFELFIAGMEISNGYNELNEPFDQAERFREQIKSHAASQNEAHQFDADYVLALEYGLPPTTGIGIGIDRLVMLLTNTHSIKEVILFPTLKKKV
jgi:lysyl-tRNA synthetase class 2